MKLQTASSRIWIQFTVSIFYYSNHYSTKEYIYMYIYIYTTFDMPLKSKSNLYHKKEPYFRFCFIMIDFLVYFDGMSTCMVLFYAQRLGNCLRCTFIFIFLYNFKRVFFHTATNRSGLFNTMLLWKNNNACIYIYIYTYIAVGVWSDLIKDCVSLSLPTERFYRPHRRNIMPKKLK